ncbi:ABC transporter ATP-binding protein [Streptococcus pneumoniae]|nr:ABC transporter ATP-binding protein [Streptococcus pneumoniae]
MVNNVAVKVSNLSKEFLLGQDKNSFERYFLICQLWGICINTWCQWFWKVYFAKLLIKFI